MIEDKRFTLTNRSLSEIGNDIAIADNGVPCTQRFVCNLLNELIEENGQLKQRNNRQAKQLDRLYNLIEEKDWRTLTDILDDFKRCEEQLQREWKCYE